MSEIGGEKVRPQGSKHLFCRLYNVYTPILVLNLKF